MRELNFILYCFVSNVGTRILNSTSEAPGQYPVLDIEAQQEAFVSWLKLKLQAHREHLQCHPLINTSSNHTPATGVSDQEQSCWRWRWRKTDKHAYFLSRPLPVYVYIVIHSACYTKPALNHITLNYSSLNSTPHVFY